MTCSKDYDYKCDDCVNAWDLSRMYSCYESPNPVTNLVTEVDIDDCVEANQGGERFWVRVTEVCVCYVIGIVFSKLVFPHPFNTGEKIRLEIYHIYNVAKNCNNIIEGFDYLLQENEYFILQEGGSKLKL